LRLYHGSCIWSVCNSMSMTITPELPPEIWSRVYELTGPNELMALCCSSHQAQSLIEALHILRARLEAMQFKNPWERADALYKAGTACVMDNIRFSMAAEELIDLPYLKVRLCSEISKAWAKKGDMYTAREYVEKAVKVAESIQDLMHKIQVFITIIKAEKEIGDTEVASHTISLLENSIACISDSVIRRQHEQIVDRMRQA
jgi:hypothetical protein